MTGGWGLDLMMIFSVGWRPVRSPGNIHPDPAPSDCGQQLLNNLQEQVRLQLRPEPDSGPVLKIFLLQALEERGGHQESREAEVDEQHQV